MKNLLWRNGIRNINQPNLRLSWTGQPVPEEVVKSVHTTHDEENAMVEAIFDMFSSGLDRCTILTSKSKTFVIQTVLTANNKQELKV